MLLTDKQERFAHNIAVKRMTQREAWIQAAYSDNYSMAILDSNACTLANTKKIQARMTEMRNILTGPDIMDRREMLQRLTTISRADVTDFQTCGADGSYIDIGPDNEKVQAVAEITSRTEYNKEGADAAVITKLKLHDPLSSMRDIAKTLGWTAPDTLIQDNRVINITVENETGRKLLDRVLSGEGPETEGNENTGETP